MENSGNTEQRINYRKRYNKFLRQTQVSQSELVCTTISDISYSQLLKYKASCNSINDPETKRFLKDSFEEAIKEKPGNIFYRYVGGVLNENAEYLIPIAKQYYTAKKYREALLISISVPKENLTLLEIRNSSFENLCRLSIGDVDSSSFLLEKFKFQGNVETLISMALKELPSDVAYEYFKGLSRRITNETLASTIIQLLTEKYPDKDVVAHINNMNKWLSFNDKIAQCEKDIAYSEGSFVWHDSFGLGRIRKIEWPYYLVQFAKSPTYRRMSQEIVYKSLTPLPKKHIKVLKAASIEKLREKTIADPAWAFKVLINSYGGSVTLAEIRKELEGKVIKNYFNWIQSAIDVINKDPHFVQISKNGRIGFAYSEQPIEKDIDESDLPIIPPKFPIHIRQQNFLCLSKQHNLKSFYTYIPIQNGRRIDLIKVFIDYCKNCKKFFISETEFSEKLGNKTSVLLRYFVSGDGTHFGPTMSFDKNGALSNESALKKSGYTVSKQSDLGPHERQEILDEVILYGVLDVQSVKSYLQFYIGYLGKSPNMEDAVDNWMIDLNYINNKYSALLSSRFFQEL